MALRAVFISKAHAEMDGAAHNTTPGPGKYAPEEVEHRRYGKGSSVRFGQAKNGNDINADLNRSLAKQKAIKEAIDPVPGPGHYKFKEGKMLNITHAHTKFGKATRATDSKSTPCPIIRLYASGAIRAASKRALSILAGT